MPTLDATITVGNNPSRTVSAGGFIWVLNPTDSSVSKIDPATNTVTATLSIATADDLAADSTYLYAVDSSAGTVKQYTLSGSLVRTISGISGRKLVGPIHAGYGYCFCAVLTGNKAARITPATGVVTEVSLGTPAHGVNIIAAWTAGPEAGNQFASVHNDGGSAHFLAKIYPPSFTLSASYPQTFFAAASQGAAYENGHIWLTDASGIDGRVVKISNSGATLLTVTLSFLPANIVYESSTPAVWVSDFTGNFKSLDLTTGGITGTVGGLNFLADVWCFANSSVWGATRNTDVAYRIGNLVPVVNPTFSAISPSSGHTAGGTPVGISGTGFQTGLTVTIGGVACSSVVVNTSTGLDAVTGAHPAVGAVSVVITNPDGGGVTAAAAYTYTATTPTIASVSPNSGPQGGGTPVSIAGTGFASGAGQAVTFGGGSATSIVVVSDTLITCVTPAGTGVVNVVVTNPSGAGAATLSSSYTYTTPPPSYNAGSQLFYDFQRKVWLSGAYGSLQMLATDPTQGAPKVYALTADGSLIQMLNEAVPGWTATSGNAGLGLLQTMPLNLGNMTSLKTFHGFVMVVNDVTAITASGGITSAWKAYLYVDNVNKSTPPIQVPLSVNTAPFNTMPVGTIEGGNSADNNVGELIGTFVNTDGGPVVGHNAYLEIYYPVGTPSSTPTSGSNSGPLNLPWCVYRMDVWISPSSQSEVEP